MYKKILVPLDGSKRAEKVLSHVERLALCFGAKVSLLRVIRPPSMVVHDPSALKRFQDNFQKLHKNFLACDEYFRAFRDDDYGIFSCHTLQPASLF